MRATWAATIAGLGMLVFAISPAEPAQRARSEPAQVFVEPSPTALRALKPTPVPRSKVQREARRTSTAQAEVVGERRLWPALDAVKSTMYLKYFTLRAVGTNIEVWVASDQDATSKGLEFPPGDCRNDDRVQITDAQAQYLVQQFDQTIYPREASAFSVPLARDGSRALLPAQQGLPANYYNGAGGHIVALVDNVRDEQFYDVNVRVGIGGVFVPSFDEQVDRNVITIDAVDWSHRTGSSPPNDPVPGDLCRSRSARPFLIESTFAHEYQHLLESYEDSDEVSWVNEGLSMFAESLTGYLDSTKPVTAAGFSSSAQCFLGYSSVQTTVNPNPTPGGPENSLTIWGDRNGSEILCDYGAAETFMEYLAARFGLDFMSALHKDNDNGLTSLRKLTGTRGVAGAEVIHDWAAMVALDGVLDRGFRLTGGQPAKYRVPTLAASINWNSPDAYLNPGAPPNGSDYVRLKGAGNRFLKASQIRSIAFDGSVAFPRRPVEWTVDPQPLDHPGNPALHSGSGGGIDRGLVRQVKVPSSAPKLTFTTRYDLAPGLDFAFVEVSTNGGRTWRSLANALTSTSAATGAVPTVRRNLPGLTGKSGQGPFPAWVTTSFDLSAYRGKTVLLAFRYVSDPHVTYPGWWIDDIRVGRTLISDGASLVGWKSFSKVSGEREGSFTVQFVGHTSGGVKRAFIYRLRLDANLRGELSEAKLRRLLAGGYQVVAAIVTYDEPTEAKPNPAQYVLRVNGILQRGGRATGSL
jgi:Immune inhibitor A-like, MAM domain